MALRVVSFDSYDRFALESAAAQKLTGVAVSVGGGGSGYSLNDTLTLVVPGALRAMRLNVDSEVGGVITGVSIVDEGAAVTIPSNPVGVTGGTGADDATFDLTTEALIDNGDVEEIKEVAGRWWLYYWV